MEMIGASLISVGAGMFFVPAGIVAAGAFILTFAIALERSRAI